MFKDLKHLKISHITAGFIAVLVGYSSSVAIIFQAIEILGATQAQANSWMLALGLGMGISGLVLSLRYKMPILTAWSTPGAALLVVSLSSVSMPQAIGAFLFCGLLLTLTGITGLFEKIAHLIPQAIASAMLAGVLFQFGLGVFKSFEVDQTLAAIMCLTYLVGKTLFPRYTIPLVLLIGIITCYITGSFQSIEKLTLEIARPEFVFPEFTLSALIGIGIPLYIVTMTSQNIPGVAALNSAGYKPPISNSITVTGITTLLLAPFGGYAFNLAAITAAICAGEEAGDDKSKRYLAVVMAGVFYCIVGLFGATVISLFLVAPKTLVITVAGLALLSTIANSLSSALEKVEMRDAAIVTFLTTISGISFFEIGAPVWGLLFGGLVSIAKITKEKKS